MGNAFHKSDPVHLMKTSSVMLIVYESSPNKAQQINFEVDSDNVQELLNSHSQEMTIEELIEMHEQEQDIDELEPLHPVQSED
ncbi:hypothetical protein TNCV_3059301 [Trichonephila clavipes]|nr:hypothetical protein TNCV_3059301 [Trichonephila clavipes]